MRAARRRVGAAWPAGLLVLLVVVAVLAPVLEPMDPDRQDLLRRFEGPGADHWLGTDAFGRDVLSRLIHGTRVSMVAVGQATTLAIALGVPTGLLAGYRRGWVDAVLGRVSDALLAMPPLLFAIGIVAALGPGLTNAMVALAIVFAPRFFRVARAAALSVREQPYIEASRAAGCSPARILVRHVLPNTAAPLLAQATFTAGLVLTAEASLSFLGLGLQPPEASWGIMVREAFQHVHTEGYQLLPPTVTITVAILTFFLTGDRLRDAVGHDLAGRRP